MSALPQKGYTAALNQYALASAGLRLAKMPSQPCERLHRDWDGRHPWAVAFALSKGKCSECLLHAALEILSFFM